MKTSILLIRLGALFFGGLLAAANAGGSPGAGSRSAGAAETQAGMTFKYSIGATNLVFTLRPEGLVIDEPAFARSATIPAGGGKVDEARLVDSLRAFGIEDARIKERLLAIKGRIRDNLGLRVAGRGSFHAGSAAGLEPAGSGTARTGSAGDGRVSGSNARFSAGASQNAQGQEPESGSVLPAQGAGQPESMANMIDRGVRLSGSLRGSTAASRIFREAGNRLRTAQDVMTRSQAFLAGPGRDQLRGLAIKEELASSRKSLEDSIKDLENLMEEIRENRQNYQDEFEDIDQKVNQLFNILSAVLKTEKETEGSIARNLL